MVYLLIFSKLAERCNMAKDTSKTEDPTPRRREKAREEGNVAKSQEASKMATVIAGFIALYFYAPTIIQRTSNIFVYFLKDALLMPITEENAYAVVLMTVMELAILVMPVILFIGFFSFLTVYMQVGFLWTTKVFKIKWENFNIFKGIKRNLFSLQTFVRLSKTLALALVIGYMAYLFIRKEFIFFLNLYYVDAAGIGIYMLETGFKLVLLTFIPMVGIAIFDIWYSFYDHKENLKMSKQEVKDEQKQSEGDPLIKNKQRQKMMQVMSNRMMQDIPKADVILTNPTHYAVALRYDPTVFPAPLVVAKGADKVALRIKDIAREHSIPIRENRPLARSLFETVEVGDPIPEDLFKAVAAILAEIWKLQGKMSSKVPPPQ